MNICGVILAGGESSRMGRPKPLLELSGRNFAEVISGKLREAGIGEIYVVLGARASYIDENLNLKGVKILINEDWEKGQLSSLKKAVGVLRGSADALVVCLIDHPQVSEKTLETMLKRFGSSDCDILVPSYNGKGGHPVIFRNTVFGALLSAPLAGGAKTVVRDGRWNVERVAVKDAFVIQDIDTPEEYEKIHV
ncbi:MAG: nucleotidyltransferase family protein [Elusimicrobia bacterium]|nr:nucleotidyltransferase family protein [Elusimicrobiota bacterium]